MGIKTPVIREAVAELRSHNPKESADLPEVNIALSSDGEVVGFICPLLPCTVPNLVTCFTDKFLPLVNFHE